MENCQDIEYFGGDIQLGELSKMLRERSYLISSDLIRQHAQRLINKYHLRDDGNSHQRIARQVEVLLASEPEDNLGSARQYVALCLFKQKNNLRAIRRRLKVYLYSLTACC